MKHSMILMIGLFLAGAGALPAQNGQTPDHEAETVAVADLPEPKYDNSVVYYDVTDNTIKDLEITRAETETKGNGLSMLPIGVGGNKTNLVLQGGASTVVLPRSAEFLIKLSAGDVNPNNWVMLYQLEQKIRNNPAKSQRFMVVSKTSGFGVSVFNNYKTKSVSGDAQLNQLFERVSPGVYRLRPAAPLEPGEYFFSITDPNAEQSTSPMVYAFGVR